MTASKEAQRKDISQALKDYAQLLEVVNKLRESEELAKIWKYGFIWDGKRDSWGRKQNYVSAKTINYIIKYVTKVDLKHKFYKQIILTSAGIGAGYMKRTDWIKNKFNPNGETREYSKTETGHKQALPIYWRNKIYSEEEREKLWLQKLDKGERYVNGQRIDISENFNEYWKAIKGQEYKTMS